MDREGVERMARLAIRLRKLAIQAAWLYLVLRAVGPSRSSTPCCSAWPWDTFTMVTKLGLDKKSPKRKGTKKGSQTTHHREGVEEEELKQVRMEMKRRRRRGGGQP